MSDYLGQDPPPPPFPPMRPAARMGSTFDSERVARAIAAVIIELGLLIWVVWLARAGNWHWAWFIVALVATGSLRDIRGELRNLRDDL